ARKQDCLNTSIRRVEYDKCGYVPFVFAYFIKFMKSNPMKILASFFLLLISVSLSAQEIQYQRKNDLPYYENSVKQDDYMKSQCLLDIYYPENKKGFATIVYFHGGGITGGSKEIPKALTEKGFA